MAVTYLPIAAEVAVTVPWLWNAIADKGEKR
jgi:hypothetical protein